MPSDRDVVERVYDQLAPRAEALGIRSLALPEQHVLAAVTGKGVIDNGGFGYFYESFTEIDLVADSFEALGFLAAAAACRRSMEVLPSPSGFPDLELQRQWLAEHVPEDGPIEAFWDKLSPVIWGITSTDFDSRMAAYIRSHPAVFVV